MGKSDDEYVTPEDLVAYQTEIYKRVQRIKVNYSKDGRDSSRRTRQAFQARLLKLQEASTQYQTQHRQIISSKLKTTHDYYVNDHYEQFDELHLEMHTFLLEEMEKYFPTASIPADDLNTSSITTIRSQNQNELAVRLPKIPLPSFSGKYTDWPSFHDSFRKLVHTNNKLADIEKFHHLKQALPINFDSDIRDISLTDANYSIAYQLLVTRYNNKRVLFSHYMNMLSNQPNIKSESAHQIKQLLDVSRLCLSSLRHLEIPIDQCDHILVHFLVAKLPSDSHRLWEEKLGISTDVPQFKTFSSFLEIRFRTLEAIELKSTLSQTGTQSTDCRSSDNNNNRNTSSKEKRSSKSFNVTVKTNNNDNSKPFRCVLCSESHVIRQCQKFLSLDCYERKKIADQNKLCVNCLSGTHSFNKCSSIKNCQQCGKRHHTLLHFPQIASNNIVVSSPSSVSSSKNTDTAPTDFHSLSNHHISNNTLVQFNHNKLPSSDEVLLPTALLNLCTSDGKFVVIRALLDQGSQGALITERLVQSLKLPRTTVQSDLNFPAGRTSSCKYITTVKLQSMFDSNCTFEIMARVMKIVTNQLPTRSFTSKHWPHITGLQLADPSFNQSRQIDLLLGADVYAKILMNGLARGNSDEPIAQQTTLGWIVSGDVFEPKQSVTRIKPIQCSNITLPLETLVQKFYELEGISSDDVATNEEIWCEQFFQRTHKRQSTGKYLVRLPFKFYFDPSQTIGKSKQMALNRFHALERKLNRDPGLKLQYQMAIQEYFELNQIQPVSSSESQHIQTDQQHQLSSYSCHTIPHHAIIKESSTTTKCRIVFDASAKTSNGKSLNDVMCVGPKMQNELPAVLLNWRLYRYVYTCDMQKMYRCIDVHEPDTQFQRILWRDEHNNIQEYRLTTVTFGTAPAPYLAIRVIHQLAEDEAHRFPFVVSILKKEIYVDDVFSGGDTIEQTSKMKQQLIQVLESAGLLLRKWASNSPQILSSIPVEHQTLDPSLPITDGDSVKTLGMFWHPGTDCFHYKIKFEIESINVTKRTVLSAIARLYDPMGLIGPIVVRAKMFLKQLWTLNLSWDELIPPELKTEWINFVTDLPAVENIQIPRWLKFTASSVKHFEIHAFCDGSKNAYASVIYFRIQTTDDQIHSNIIMAKNKITPAKPTLCIPRIELCAALLNAKLVQWILQHFKLNLESSQIYFWTDATIVLSWLRGDQNRWPVFVTNRISKIRSISHTHQWHHVNTKDNPADCLSRGLSPVQLKHHHLYWNGPDWLCTAQSEWPKSEWTFLEPEMKQIPSSIINSIVVDGSFIQRCSSFTKLCRITAYVLRFINNCKSPKMALTGTLLVREIDDGLNTLIRIVQRESFATEYHTLISKREIPTKSKILSLAPFLDQNNVIRVYGRLQNAPIPYDEKHPMILPRNHHFTQLLINYAHLSTLHGGTQLTASFLRKRFWIVHARKMIQLQIKKCIKCFKVKPQISNQQMGNLPSSRVTPSRPFANTGVDFTGSFELKASRYRGNTTYKGYIAVFICLATKAVHLEIVTGMDTPTFLAALERFHSRRGLCTAIYCDNGTNFMGASTILRQSSKQFIDQFEKNVSSKIINRGIQWHFIPPHSPNFGGLWEANVKAVKYHLKRMVDGSPQTYEDLSTLVNRIEAVLNSRPLCPLNADPEDFQVLTPGHFLVGDALLAPPNQTIMNLPLTQRYLNMQRMYQQFWSNWSSDWLSHLQSRPKWLTPTENLKLNDLVIIKDDNQPPNHWLLGRIIELHPGDDKLVRVVTLKTKKGTYKRSVSKLCRLPIENHSNST